MIAETPRVPIAATPARSRFLLGFVAGISVALGGVFSGPAILQQFRSANLQEVRENNDTPPVRELAQAPAPREVVTAFRIPPPSVPPIDEKPVEVTPEPVVVALPEAAPRNPFRPEAPRALVLDRAQHYSPRVPPGSTVAIRGWVKTLIVKDLEAGAVLDCSELEAEEVIVVGKIEGGSRLSLRSSDGRVTFRAKIDGRSKVEVRASGGTVSFETPTGMGRDGSKIDGGSTVEIHARLVGFRGQIAGADTRVSVTLSSGGRLAFAEIDGTARLEYGQLDPDDAEPTIVKGRVGPAAVVAKVE